MLIGIYVTNRGNKRGKKMNMISNYNNINKRGVIIR